MNIKKILAAASASILTVSAMSIAASAAEMLSGVDAIQEDDGMLKVAILGETAPAEFKDVNFVDVAGVAVVIEYDEPAEKQWAGGSVVFTSESASWAQVDWSSDETNTSIAYIPSGQKTTIMSPKPFADSDTYAVIAFQNFASEGGPDMTVKALDLLDKDGNVLASIGSASTPAESTPESTPAESAPESTPAESTPESTPAESTPESTPAESTPAESDAKDPVATGVGGVAAVLGVAVVAAGAMVVAKKRK